MIRPAHTSDLPLILEIMNDAISNSTAIYEYAPWSLEKITQWYNERISYGFPIIVYEDGNKAVGYATFGSFRARVAYRFTIEHSVYVNKDFRAKGIGKLLLTDLISVAKTSGYRSMIGMVDATNKRSVEFHKKLGFHKVGQLKEVGHKFDVWLDVALLQCML